MQTKTLTPEEGNKLVDLSCMNCGKEFRGEEPQMCCNGYQCGCMGMPIDPIVCSKECYDGLINSVKNGKQVALTSNTDNNG